MVSSKVLPVGGVPPSPREAHVLLALQDPHRILLLGGGSISPVFGPQQYNDLFLLDLKESRWSYIPSKGDQPSPRTGISAVVLGDDRVLIFGGSSMTEGYMDDVYVLDTKEWVWSRPVVKGEPPSPRDKHTACLVGSKLYIFGGFGPLVSEDGSPTEDGSSMDPNDSEDDDGGEDANDMSEDCENEDEDTNSEGGPSMSFTWFNDLHVLDVKSMEWEMVETKGLKPSPRAAHAAFVARMVEQSEKRDKIIVFGGRDPIGRQNDLFSLDLQSMGWRKEVVNAPSPRSFHTMVPLGDSQMAVCYGGIGANEETFPGLELLNLVTMEWTPLKLSSGSWPPPRGASAMVASFSKEEPKLIIFGGSCTSENHEMLYYNDTHGIFVDSLLSGGR